MLKNCPTLTIRFFKKIRFFNQQKNNKHRRNPICGSDHHHRSSNYNSKNNKAPSLFRQEVGSISFQKLVGLVYERNSLDNPIPKKWSHSETRHGDLFRRRRLVGWLGRSGPWFLGWGLCGVGDGIIYFCCVCVDVVGWGMSLGEFGWGLRVGLF